MQTKPHLLRHQEANGDRAQMVSNRSRGLEGQNETYLLTTRWQSMLAVDCLYILCVQTFHFCREREKEVTLIRFGPLVIWTQQHMESNGAALTFAGTAGIAMAVSESFRPERANCVTGSHGPTGGACGADDVRRHRQRQTRHARQCAKLGFCMRMRRQVTRLVPSWHRPLHYQLHRTDTTSPRTFSLSLIHI